MDHDIIEFLAAKDERAVALMAERYEKLIRYIAVTILGDRSESVEECINDVYMKIWMKGHLYDFEKASFKTYLKAVTRNAALNHLRKLKRLEELEGLDESDTIQSEYIDYRQNVEQQMIFQEEVQALNRILRELKKKIRNWCFAVFTTFRAQGRSRQQWKCQKTQWTASCRVCAKRLRNDTEKRWENESLE